MDSAARLKGAILVLMGLAAALGAFLAGLIGFAALAAVATGPGAAVPKSLPASWRPAPQATTRTHGVQVASRWVRTASPRLSGYRGVYPHRPTGRWIARISLDGHVRHLGIHDDPEDAAMAYDRAARVQWGPFARPNGFA